MWGGGRWKWILYIMQHLNLRCKKFREIGAYLKAIYNCKEPFTNGFSQIWPHDKMNVLLTLVATRLTSADQPPLISFMKGSYITLCHSYPLSPSIQATRIIFYKWRILPLEGESATYHYCHPSAYGLGLASRRGSARQEIRKLKNNYKEK